MAYKIGNTTVITNNAALGSVDGNSLNLANNANIAGGGGKIVADTVFYSSGNFVIPNTANTVTVFSLGAGGGGSRNHGGGGGGGGIATFDVANIGGAGATVAVTVGAGGNGSGGGTGGGGNGGASSFGNYLVTNGGNQGNGINGNPGNGGTVSTNGSPIVVGSSSGGNGWNAPTGNPNNSTHGGGGGGGSSGGSTGGNKLSPANFGFADIGSKGTFSGNGYAMGGWADNAAGYLGGDGVVMVLAMG